MFSRSIVRKLTSAVGTSATSTFAFRPTCALLDKKDFSNAKPVEGFAAKDIDPENLQHAYWDSDEDFLVPYADEGFNLLDGDEFGDEFMGMFHSEVMNVPAGDKKLLKNEQLK